MTRWKKGETKFRVAVNRTGEFSRVCRIPPPVLGMLGDPDHIEFIVKGNQIEIVASRNR